MFCIMFLYCPIHSVRACPLLCFYITLSTVLYVMYAQCFARHTTCHRCLLLPHMHLVPVAPVHGLPGVGRHPFLSLILFSHVFASLTSSHILVDFLNFVF